MTEIHVKIAHPETEIYFTKLLERAGGDANKLIRRVLALANTISDFQDDGRTIIAQSPATDPDGKDEVVPNIWS